jgi:hypothetical protein
VKSGIGLPEAMLELRTLRGIESRPEATGSDTAAMRAARTLLERSAGVEVWKSANRLAHLSTAGRGGPLYGTYGRLSR